MKNMFNKNRTSEFYLNHSNAKPKGKNSIKIFSPQMLLAYGVSSFVIWLTFFTIIPKVRYAKKEAWMPYLSESWKGYNVLLNNNELLHYCGLALFTTCCVLAALSFFHILMFRKEYNSFTPLNKSPITKRDGTFLLNSEN